MQGRKIRVALIAGVNKGIGSESARQIGTTAARILAGGRDATRGQAREPAS